MAQAAKLGTIKVLKLTPCLSATTSALDADDNEYQSLGETHSLAVGSVLQACVSAWEPSGRLSLAGWSARGLTSAQVEGGKYLVEIHLLSELAIGLASALGTGRKVGTIRVKLMGCPIRPSSSRQNSVPVARVGTSGSNSQAGGWGQLGSHQRSVTVARSEPSGWNSQAVRSGNQARVSTGCRVGTTPGKFATFYCRPRYQISWPLRRHVYALVWH